MGDVQPRLYLDGLKNDFGIAEHLNSDLKNNIINDCIGSKQNPTFCKRPFSKLIDVISSPCKNGIKSCPSPLSDSLNEESEFFNSPLPSESFYGMNTEDMIFNNSLIIDEGDGQGDISQIMELENMDGCTANTTNGTAVSASENYLKDSLLLLKSGDVPKRRRRRKRFKNPLLPKKAPSAYLLWLAENRKRLKEEDPSLPSTAITKVLASQWSNLKDKSKWIEEARLRSEQYYKEKEENIKERAKINLQIGRSEDNETPLHVLALPEEPCFWIDALKKRKRKHDKYDELVNPKVQTFSNLLYETTVEDQEYFANSDVSSLSEDSEWVLPKRIRKRRIKERKKLQARIMKIKKKKDQARPKKPLTAYMLFLMKTRKKLMEQFPQLKMQEITAKAGELWNECKDKSEYEELANQRKEIYAKEIVEYERLKAEEISLVPGDDIREEFSLCKDFSQVSDKTLSRMLAKEMILRKKKRKKRIPRDKNLPKRPPTAFFLFRGQMWEKLKAGNPGISTMELSKKVAEMWKNVCDKTPWKFEAKTKREQYLQEMEHYRQSLAASQEDPSNSTSTNSLSNQPSTTLPSTLCHSPSPLPSPLSPSHLPLRVKSPLQKSEEEEDPSSDSSDSSDSSLSSHLSADTNGNLSNRPNNNLATEHNSPKNSCSSASGEKSLLQQKDKHPSQGSLSEDLTGESKLEDKSDIISNVKVEMISPLHIPSYNHYYESSSEDDSLTPYNANIKKTCKVKEEDLSSDSDFSSSSTTNKMDSKICLDTHTSSTFSYENDSVKVMAKNKDQNAPSSEQHFEQCCRQTQINGPLPSNFALDPTLPQTDNKANSQNVSGKSSNMHPFIISQEKKSLTQALSPAFAIEDKKNSLLNSQVTKEASNPTLNLRQTEITANIVNISSCSNQTKSLRDLTHESLNDSQVAQTLSPSQMTIALKQQVDSPAISKQTTFNGIKVLESGKTPNSAISNFSHINSSQKDSTDTHLDKKVGFETAHKISFSNVSSSQTSSKLNPNSRHSVHPHLNKVNSDSSQKEKLVSTDKLNNENKITQPSHNSTFVQTKNSQNFVTPSHNGLPSSNLESSLFNKPTVEFSHKLESTQPPLKIHIPNKSHSSIEANGKSQSDSSSSSQALKLPPNAVARKLDFFQGTHILKMQGGNLIISRKSSQGDQTTFNCQPLRTTTLLPSQNISKLGVNGNIVLTPLNTAPIKNENTLARNHQENHSSSEASNQKILALPASLQSQKKEVVVKPLSGSVKPPSQNFPFIQHILKVQNQTPSSKISSPEEMKIVKPSLSIVNGGPHSKFPSVASLQIQKSPMGLTLKPALQSSLNNSENKKGYAYLVRAQNQPSQQFYVISSGQAQIGKLPNGQLVNNAHNISSSGARREAGKANILKATLTDASLLKQKLDETPNVNLLQPSFQGNTSLEKVHVISPSISKASPERSDTFSPTLKQEPPSKHG